MRLISEAGQLNIPADGTANWVEQLRVADLSVGTYSIPAGGTDEQSPHTEDEIYVITAGRAVLTGGANEAGGQDEGGLAVGPGSVVYVAAREPHRFVDITEDLAALVVFAPPEESRAEQASTEQAGPEQAG